MTALHYEILHENVYYFPGAIVDVSNVMKTLDEISNESISPWQTWYANNDDSESRYGDLKVLSYSKLEAELNESIRRKSEYVLTSILNPMEAACREFMQQHGASEAEIKYMTKDLLHGGHDFGIRRYDESRDMGPHPDMVVDGRETITIAVYLDDDYTGGELAIVHKGLNIVIKNVAGSIVVFPSNYLHESRMLTSGRKTIITHVHLAMTKIIEGN